MKLSEINTAVDEALQLEGFARVEALFWLLYLFHFMRVAIRKGSERK